MVFWRALFLWAIVLLGSIALAEIPAVGNRAILSFTETDDNGNSIQSSVSHEIVSYNPDNEEFTLEKSSSLGRSKWQAHKDNLASAELLEEKVRRCRSRGGTFIENHSVEAGTFPACRLDLVSEDGVGVYYVGVVPFGTLDFRFTDTSGKTTRYELLDFEE